MNNLVPDFLAEHILGHVAVQEAEKRLRDIVAGKRPAGALATANGGRGRGAMAKAGRQPMLVFTVRFSLWASCASCSRVAQ